MYKYHVSWEQVEDSVDRIVKQLDFSPTMIIAINRGGIIPAALIQRRFPKAKICVKSPTQHISFLDGEALNTLLVDDIWDTGQTIETFWKLNGYVSTAVLGYRNPLETTKIFYGTKIQGSAWIVFPWEKGEKCERSKI